jgi:hypothetical protein
MTGPRKNFTKITGDDVLLKFAVFALKFNGLNFLHLILDH